MLPQFALVSLFLLLAMAAAWQLQKWLKNAGWVDVVWSFATGLGGVAAAYPWATPRALIVAALALAWSFRLGLHIAARTRHGPEDVRYASFRTEWGEKFQSRLFWFLMIQAAAAALLVLSMLVAAHNPAPGLRAMDAAGIAVMIVAVLGEGIADRQMQNFRADKTNRGGICEVGLWRWSRHPNYFFEWLGWFAYPLLAIDLTGGYLPGWLALTGPAFMYWLLVHVSGVPPLEREMLRSRGDAFRAYQQRTRAFFPPALPHKGIAVTLVSATIDAVERLPLPDALTRLGTAYLVEQTHRKLAAIPAEFEAQFAADMADRPIAEHVDDANAQHYELPPAFFALTLGPRRKYSCCLYVDETTNLAAAEELALTETAAHAGLADGQHVLELGCGWGSLSLWMARRYPNARITAVSNSVPQRLHIEGQAAMRGLRNLTVVTADMNNFVPSRTFDRIVSVEMFEHMSNWRPLLVRLRKALRPEGRLFLHVFTHRSAPYRFDHADPADWIAQHFFTGGIMPSHGLIRRFPDLFAVEEEWRWNGLHYQRTAQDWLANFDRNAHQINALLGDVYGAKARLWKRRWRLFFLATAGLFGHADGEIWGVSHYRLAASG